MGVVVSLDSGVLFAVVLGVLVCLTCVNDSIAENPDNRRWWHLRPWSPIIVGAVLGGTLAFLIWPILFNHADEPPWWVAVAIESSGGWLLSPEGGMFLGVLGGVIVGLLLELLFPQDA